MSNGDSKWYQNADARGYNNMLGTQAWPEYNENLFRNTGIGHFDPSNIMLPSNLSRDLGASNYQAPPPKEEIINQKYTPYKYHIPEIEKPGANWPGFGITRALAETGFRMKGGPYYSQKFPSREFTEGDRTYTQSGLGGYYHPDEVFNMQQFGGVGEYGDPRVDAFGKNIVSFADDYEEGIENWISKYGSRKSTDVGFNKRRDAKIAMWNKIKERRRGNKEKAQADAAARVAAERQAGAAANQMTQRREGRGGTHMSRSVGQGGLGISQAQAQQVSDANRAAGMGGWGLAQGGRIGYNRGRVVNPGGYQGDEFEDENVLEFMQDQGIPHSEMAEGPSPFELRIEELMDEGMSWQEAYEIASQEFATAEGPEESFNQEGIASIV